VKGGDAIRETWLLRHLDRATLGFETREQALEAAGREGLESV
jgi:hypothetical protein